MKAAARFRLWLTWLRTSLRSYGIERSVARLLPSRRSIDRRGVYDLSRQTVLIRGGSGVMAWARARYGDYRRGHEIQFHFDWVGWR